MRVHVPIRLRWSDLDAYGHVNNAEMLRLLEEARIETFWVDDSGDVRAQSTAVLDGRPGATTIALMAHQEVEYLLPIPYMRRPLDVQLWMGRLGGASLEISYEVRGPADQQPSIVYARASTTIVLVDRDSGRPRRITPAEREAWTPYLEAPVHFSRRGAASVAGT